jgi:hypothetical protein
MACFGKRYISEPTVFVETEPPVTRERHRLIRRQATDTGGDGQNAVDAESQAVAREEL